MNWYLRQGTKPIGPHTTEELAARLQAGELDPHDLVWKEGVNDWQPAMEWPEFRALSVPAFQEQGVDEAAEIWTVLEMTGEGKKVTGPWSLKTVRQAIADGIVKETDYIWKRGMSGWAKIALRPERLAISRDPESPSPL